MQPEKEWTMHRHKWQLKGIFILYIDEKLEHKFRLSYQWSLTLFRLSYQWFLTWYTKDKAMIGILCGIAAKSAFSKRFQWRSLAAVN